MRCISTYGMTFWRDERYQGFDVYPLVTKIAIDLLIFPYFPIFSNSFPYVSHVFPLKKFHFPVNVGLPEGSCTCSEVLGVGVLTVPCDAPEVYSSATDVFRSESAR